MNGAQQHAADVAVANRLVRPGGDHRLQGAGETLGVLLLRAETMALAREGDQEVVAARAAACTGEAESQCPALKKPGACALIDGTWPWVSGPCLFSVDLSENALRAEHFLGIDRSVG